MPTICSMSIINDALSPSVGTAGVGKKGKGGVDCFSISALISDFIVSYLLTSMSLYHSKITFSECFLRFEKRCKTVLSSVLFLENENKSRSTNHSFHIVMFYLEGIGPEECHFEFFQFCNLLTSISSKKIVICLLCSV